MGKYLVQVVMDYLEHRKSWSRTLTSDGVQLLSYGEVIGRWEGEVLALPSEIGRHFSQTTKRHLNMLRSTAALRSIEVKEMLR